MDVRVAASLSTTSSPVSTPPGSPLLRCPSPPDTSAVDGADHTTALSTALSKTKTNPADGAKKIVRRKKVEELDENGNPKPPKERKPRKPREPKEPKDATKPPRKKQKVSADAVATTATTAISLPHPSIAAAAIAAAGISLAPKPSSTLTTSLRSSQLERQQQQHTDSTIVATKIEPGTAQQSIDTMSQPAREQQHQQRLQPLPPLPRSTTTGTRYDPVRSQYTVAAKSPTQNGPVTSQTGKTGSPSVRAPSSIFSLIEPPPRPPPALTTEAPAQVASPTPVLQSVPIFTSDGENGSNANPELSSDQTKSTEKLLSTRKVTSEDIAPLSPEPTKTTLYQSKPSKPDTVIITPSSPKSGRQRDLAPSLPPLGSGLLSNSAFGRPSATLHKLAEIPNQCIVIDVPRNKGDGNHVNFMKEVEAKYGFDVAYPRIAEHRRRMRAVAAAGAAIESGSGSADEMALDAMSDGESNADMGGVMDDESGAASEGVHKRKGKRVRANQYDKNDDFIDDAELLWEEQALASRDGYFVWSGPLINEADKPAAERADGTTKRGGRGRGRGGTTRGDKESSSRVAGGRGGAAGSSGRGSRGGGSGHAAAAAAAAGPNGTTTATVRKPRKRKAERDKAQPEKVVATQAQAKDSTDHESYAPVGLSATTRLSEGSAV